MKWFSFLQIPAALDAGTVGLLLGKPRNKISALLSDLAKKDVFQYAYLQNNVGRPLKFYAPKTIGNLEDLNRRKQFYALTLFRTYAVELLFDKNKEWIRQK